MTKTVKATHTPGPWSWNNGMLLGSDGCIIAEKNDDAHPNAKLIAAAPELLERLKSAESLLKGLLHFFEDGHEQSCIQTELWDIKAAIAKAEGR